MFLPPNKKTYLNSQVQSYVNISVDTWNKLAMKNIELLKMKTTTSFPKCNISYF